MIYNPFDVVIVPFPFTDKKTAKKRPALVVSNATFQKKTNACILCMITSAKKSSWPYDVKIQDLATTGLNADSLIRMKMFTLDDSLILRKAGSLSPVDSAKTKAQLKSLLIFD